MSKSEQNQTALNYLYDLGNLIREAAVEAHEKSEQLKAEEKRDEFEMGRAMAYYEVAALMAQQAEAFGLNPSALGFEDFDPDRGLLGTSTGASAA